MNQPPDRRTPPAPTPELDERDSSILTYIAGQQLVTEDHIHALFVSQGQTTHQNPALAAQERMQHLATLGLLARQPIFHQRPPIYQITPRGLQAIGSNLPVPRESLRPLQHDLAAAWLSLAAARGAFGPYEYILTRRQLIGRDLAARSDARQAPPATPLEEGRASPFGVRMTTVLCV